MSTDPHIFDAARAAYERQDWRKVVDLLEGAPESPAAEHSLLLAKAHRALDDDDEAERALRRGLSHGEDAALLILLGKLQRDAGQHAGAAATYRRAIAHDPTAAEAHCQLGLVLEAQGDRTAAGTCFDRAIGLAPENGMYHLCAAKIHLWSDRTTEAEAALGRAAALLESQEGETRDYNLACVHSLRGDIPRSLAHFRAFLAGHPYALDWARQDPDLENLRASEAFVALVESAG